MKKVLSILVLLVVAYIFVLSEVSPPIEIPYEVQQEAETVTIDEKPQVKLNEEISKQMQAEKLMLEKVEKAKAFVPEEFDLASAYLLMIDYQVVQQKLTDDVFGIASLSKLMSYVVIQEEMQRRTDLTPDTIIEVPEAAVDYEESTMALDAYEQLPLGKLLNGALIKSANDAMNTLAIALLGDIRTFADRMNEKAMELGMTHTHFINPTGLTEGENYNISSANDLSKLVEYIYLNYPQIFEITRQRELSDDRKDYRKESTLAHIYDGTTHAIGLKTGFEDAAGYTLIMTYEYDDHYDTAIFLGLPNVESRTEFGIKGEQYFDQVEN